MENRNYLIDSLSSSDLFSSCGSDVGTFRFLRSLLFFLSSPWDLVTSGAGPWPSNSSPDGTAKGRSEGTCRFIFSSFWVKSIGPSTVKSSPSSLTIPLSPPKSLVVENWPEMERSMGPSSSVEKTESPFEMVSLSSRRRWRIVSTPESVERDGELGDLTTCKDKTN